MRNDGRWDWTLVLQSALLCAFAFNLIFFIQELFLVVPKALTPGLRPTLFHNNHHWTGANPLARLFQGTGALATLTTAAACALWLKDRPPRSATVRLFVIWTIFHGSFEALPQFVIGAFLPQNDVGMALDYLGLSQAAKWVVASLAVVTMVMIARALSHPFLDLDASTAQLATPGGRSGVMFRVATVPALIALVLVVPFRVPGTADQVFLAPAIMITVGILCLQGTAGFASNRSAGEGIPRSARGATRGNVRSSGAALPRSTFWPLAALLIQLAIFQLVLRHGIDFF
jgi:hypothetical protein